MRASRIQRIIRLIILLQSRRGYTAGDLAAECEVSRRTIFRDLRMLDLAGIPFYFDRAAGGYHIRSTFYLRPLNLNIEEALAILLLAQELGQGKGIPHLEQAWRAANKIESALPAEIRRTIGALADSVRITGARMTDAPRDASLFRQCREAVQVSRKARLVYRSLYEGRQVRTVLSPYALFFGERAWYVVGHSSTHRSVRMFKLGRIDRLTLTDDHFRRPARFSVDGYLGNAWHLIRGARPYNVVIRFAPKVATNVAEVRWHRTQKIAPQEDGSVLFRVRVDGIDEIAWWVLGYGPYAEVLKPAALRQKVAAMARETAARYDAGPAARNVR